MATDIPFFHNQVYHLNQMQSVTLTFVIQHWKLQTGNWNVVRNGNLKKNDQSHHFCWCCDLEHWPMTLESQSTWDNITTNMYAKFKNNPSSAIHSIHYMAGGGQCVMDGK